MASIHRIKIKLGDAEFEAEGSEERVQAQYEAFLAARQKSESAPANRVAAKPSSGNGLPPVNDTDLARIFELRTDDLVVLRVRPPNTVEEADQVALLLFGYLRLKNAQSVLATQLLKAVKHSGLGIPRIDRAAESHIPQYIMRGGQRKGTSYTLTTQGIVRAGEVAASLFG